MPSSSSQVVVAISRSINPEEGGFRSIRHYQSLTDIDANRTEIQTRAPLRRIDSLHPRGVAGVEEQPVLGRSLVVDRRARHGCERLPLGSALQAMDIRI